MSIQAITWVLENSTSKGAARLVLISLANHAHVDGTNAYPSVATMAHEAKVDDRTVERVIRDQLKPEGHIRQTGLRKSGTKVYTVVMGGGAAPPRQDAAPASRASRGGISSQGGGALPPEPSKEPSENNGVGEDARARLRSTVDDDRLVEWARQGLPGVDIDDVRRVMPDAIARVIHQGRTAVDVNDVLLCLERPRRARATT